MEQTAPARRAGYAKGWQRRGEIEAQGATPDIPATSNYRWKPCFNKGSTEINLIERFFGNFQHFRRITTRYDLLDSIFEIVTMGLPP